MKTEQEIVDQEREYLEYILGQTELGYVDISGNHGDRYDEAVVEFLVKVLNLYKEEHL